MIDDMVRAIAEAQARDIERQIREAIIEKLRTQGRIVPGEPLLRVTPDPGTGRGSVIYCYRG